MRPWALEWSYERVRVPFQVRSGDVSRRFALLLSQFLGLLAPVLDLVGAERHVLVDLGNVLLGQLGELREGDDALLGESLGGDRADALDHGQVVRFPLRRLEQ